MAILSTTTTKNNHNKQRKRQLMKRVLLQLLSLFNVISTLENGSKKRIYKTNECTQKKSCDDGAAVCHPKKGENSCTSWSFFIWLARFQQLWSTMVQNKKKHSKNSHLIIHRPMSLGVSAAERASEAGSAEQANECEVQASEWASEWPSACVSILGCSEPLCGPLREKFARRKNFISRRISKANKTTHLRQTGTALESQANPLMLLFLNSHSFFLDKKRKKMGDLEKGILPSFQRSNCTLELISILLMGFQL